MPQPKKSASSSRSASSGRRAAPRSDASATDDEARGALGALREVLARGVVITGDRVQEVLDDMVRRGHLTRETAEALTRELLELGRKQTDDLISAIEAIAGKGRDTVGRSAGETRRRTRSSVESAAAAARKAPGTDRALREVDRVRRAIGAGAAFPITGYDDLTAAQVNERLADLSPAELRKVRDHERRNANRKSVLGAIEKRLA